MNTGIANFFLNYLLLPIIFFILGLISIVVAKKNQLLSDKKSLLYILLSSLVFSLFGLCGFFGILFMPHIFLFLQFLFILLGWVNYRLLYHFVKPLKSKSPWIGLLLILLQIILAWALFSILFNLTNDLQYGFWAGTSIFSALLIPLFLLMYHSYLSIPAEIFKMRVYNTTDRFEPPKTEIDVEKLSVFEIEVPRFIEDKQPIRIKAKTMNDFVFGDWFGMIVNDYNTKKLDNQVELNDSSESYGWIFYTEGSFLKSRRYIDPEETFNGNKLKSDVLIIAKRVNKV